MRRLLEKSWKQPAFNFGADLAIATTIAAAIVRSNKRAPRCLYQGDSSVVLKHGSVTQALSPSMKNFHPLKLGGIWLIAVRRIRASSNRRRTNHRHLGLTV